MKLKLGENLRRLRKERELTQEQFSTAIGVSFQAVSRWENGTAYPDMELLPALSSFFGVSVDTLLGCPEAEKEEQAEMLLEELHKAACKVPFDEEPVIAAMVQCYMSCDSCQKRIQIHGNIHICVPKTKSSIRTVILPLDIVNILAEYKKRINSRWMFPSPQNPDVPRYPTSVGDILSILLKRAGCKHVRFHDLRHTFATMALENGTDVKTLSATIGHVSAATTLDIYSHMTDTMQMQAAVSIDRKIGGTNAQMPAVEETPEETAKPPVNAPCAPTEPHPEEDTQIRHRMPVSDQ